MPAPEGAKWRRYTSGPFCIIAAQPSSWFESCYRKCTSHCFRDVFPYGANSPLRYQLLIAPLRARRYSGQPTPPLGLNIASVHTITEKAVSPIFRSPSLAPPCGFSSRYYQPSHPHLRSRRCHALLATFRPTTLPGRPLNVKLQVRHPRLRHSVESVVWIGAISNRLTHSPH